MKSKEKILESLCGLMDESAFESITVKEICDRAGVNRSTYYRNFSSKEEVIEYRLKSVLDEYIDEFEKTEDKSHVNYIRTILETFLKHESFFKTIHKQKKSYLLQKVLLNYFRSPTDNKEDIYKSYYHIGGIYSFTICWIENDMDRDIESLAKIGAEITRSTTPLYDFKG